MIIKASENSDRNTILSIHETAFGSQAGPVIARLVADLFEDPTAAPGLSLAATDERGMAGHILFTRATLLGEDMAESPLSVSLLAPLAVLPRAQGKGVGQALILEGLSRLSAWRVDLVFVLGHPGYYPKAGFTPAGVHGLTAPYPIPKKDAGAWMVQDLRTGLLGRVQGRVQCARALDRPEHWRE